jgi:hypothetical protein
VNHTAGRIQVGSFPGAELSLSLLRVGGATSAASISRTCTSLTRTHVHMSLHHVPADMITPAAGQILCVSPCCLLCQPCSVPTLCQDLIVDPKKKAQQDVPQQQQQQQEQQQEDPLQPPNASSTAAAGQAAAADTGSTTPGLPNSSSSRPGNSGSAGVADPLSSSDPLQGDPLMSGSNSGSSHPSSSAAAGVGGTGSSSQGVAGASRSGSSKYQQALQQADPLSSQAQVGSEMGVWVCMCVWGGSTHN